MKRQSHPTADSEAVEALLIKRAIEGLSLDEQSTLEQLLRSAPAQDSTGFERTTAAIFVSRLSTKAGLPRALRARLEQQAIAYLESKTGKH
jgi:hypothetical protein